ncbi:MAG TPA: hypothetical protein VMD78_10565 [Candidatus Baltobacteraceae bacterium]|nr:hypothetical protein [Candidatus Baltobacteraceae bacterium]
MAGTQTLAHENAAGASAAKRSEPNKPAREAARRAATDDEILGIGSESTDGPAAAATDSDSGSRGPGAEAEATGAALEPENLRVAFAENPELREAWRDAQAYREAFATPDEARAATELLVDLNHMDALFFSRRPEDHAALARSVAELDPTAFASLAKAMGELATETQRHREDFAAGKGSAPETAGDRGAAESPSSTTAVTTGAKPRAAEGATAAQEEFFHATNAAAVQTVLDSIEAQVERLLPEGASKNTRNRVVGEIYRELDNTLRSNRELARQMREAFRSGALDAEHQRAIVSLIAGRARQALPGVAKRVLNEWTSTVLATHTDRRARQRAAEGRVDIAGSNRTGSENRKQMTPRDIDYARMSDADILNL